MITLAAGGELLTLLPQRAAFAAAHRTLLVADLHIGKAASFRRLGVPVPEDTTAETLASLARTVAETRAERVVFLGDFLHSRAARAPDTLQAVARWRARHAELALTLVRGNHDARAGDPPAALGIEAVGEPLVLGTLKLAHHPGANPAGYVIAGHLHPCVSVHGRANDRLRLPCFHFGPEVGVLPAFGAFTGMHAVRRVPGDRVFVVGDNEVRELP